MNSVEIKIRQLELSDIAQLTKLANCKNIWDNLRDYMPYPYHESDAKVFINLTKKQTLKQSFGIQYKEELCGVISLIAQNDVYSKSAEIGYWIGVPYWGKGIATRALELITEYGFKELNLIRIYAGVFDYNIASMEVLKKNGYQKEGIFKKAIFKNDNIYDEHRYYKLSSF